MAKQKLKVKNLASFAKFRKEINDALSEDGTALKEALLNLISELENSEVEIDETAFATSVMDLLKSMTEQEIPQEITNQIIKQVGLKVKSIQDNIASDKKLSVKVKNAVAAAILLSPKTEVKNAVEKVLTENGITGLTFEEIIDYEIATKWEDLNPLYGKFHQTFLTQFHYTDDDWKNAEIFAKGWKESNTGEKVVQQLTVKNKTITPRFIYKKQELPLEDLVRLDRNGRQSEFLNWLNREIDLILVNSIVIAILIGDNINTGQNRIVSFEPIATKWDGTSFVLKTVEDEWTSIKEYAGTLPTIQDIREMCDLNFNPNGKEKILIISQKLLTKLSEFKYGTGGTIMYRTKEEMAGQFGVSDIYITDAIESIADLKAMCIIPDGYWINEDTYISIDYPVWEVNRHIWQKERMTGGATHDLLSMSICIKEPA